MKYKTAILPVFLLALVTLLLNACGGGGGGGDSTSTTDAVGTGSVGISLTDKPANLAEVEQILITIQAVEIFSEDGQGRVTLYDGRPRGPFDLLRLEHEARPLAFGNNVPAGTYCKIRLTLTDLELVFNNGEPNYHPHLPGNNKLDLNPRECFRVLPDSKVYLQLDMDARSIHVVQTGNRTRYNFRPVVFIDVIQRDFPAKLVRLEHGVIRAIDPDAGTLRLCEFSYGEGVRGDPDDCMTIRISRRSAAFDNIENDGINRVAGGDAIPLAELLLPERVGTRPVTVVGLFSDDEYDPDFPTLDGLVVELGGFLNLGGSVANGASDIRFNMDVDPDQGISTLDPLPVALQSAPVGGNGTRILTPAGEPLSYSDIVPPRDVLVDGVLQLASPDYLNAALVVVDLFSGHDEASGTIDRVGASSLLLEADAFPCEPGVGPGWFEVGFDSGTVIYLSTAGGGSFVDSDSLAPGQEADISGECVGTLLEAATIIIRE